MLPGSPSAWGAPEACTSPSYLSSSQTSCRAGILLLSENWASKVKRLVGLINEVV